MHVDALWTLFPFSVAWRWPKDSIAWPRRLRWCSKGKVWKSLPNGSSTWHSFHRCTHFTFWSIFIHSICSSIYSTLSPVSVVVSFTGLWVSLRPGKPRPCEHYFCSLQLGFTLVRLSQSPLTSPHITSHLWYATWLSGWLLGLAGLAARSPVFGALHL